MPEAARILSVAAPEAVDDAWFDAAVCRDCGAARATTHCGQCGQKAARRLVLRDMGRETWERLRVFELKSARTIGRLVTGPGTVARDYVRGRRHSVTHPLVLLIALVAALVLLLASNRYFDSYATAPDDDVAAMSKRVMAWANWSFSLGILAVFAGSWALFRGRLGYNAVEHGVLAVYVQCLVLAAILVNMAPTLVWRDPGFVLAHKQASQYYLYAAKLVIVAVAYRQFFLLDWRRDWVRLAAACLVYVGVGWVLLRAYAAAILWLVGRS